MRDPENIRAIEALGVDLMGFIFWPKSSRYVGERPAYLPTKVKRVGVFVDDDIQNIKQKVEDFGLDIIQLHGQESPDYVRQLTSVCGDSIAIIKAFNIATAEDLKQTNAYNDIVDYFLFDTKAKMVGGNGTKFDWSGGRQRHQVRLERPHFLSWRDPIPSQWRYWSRRCRRHQDAPSSTVHRYRPELPF